MVLETTKQLIHKSVCDEKISCLELTDALLKEYESGLNDGIEITTNQLISLTSGVKKGS